MESRWVITGSNGQLGRALVRNLAAAPGCQISAAVDVDQLDLADADALRAFFDGLPSAPDVVVNAAAFTHVDRCEREPDRARCGNATIPASLARICREAGIQLVHISTDYVFSGEGECPYREEDPPAPRSVYGRTKLEGERLVLDASDAFLVVRTSWLFGDGRNFIAAVLSQAAERHAGRASGPLRVVDDQRGRPTYAVDLAQAIRELIENGARGLYHLANSGIATWWDLARACLDEAGFAELEIERTRSQELKVDAPRPTWSVLDCSKAEALGVRMRSWREAVRAYLASDASPLAARRAKP